MSLSHRTLWKATASAAGTAVTSIYTAQGAGITSYVTHVTVANKSGTDTHVQLKDGTTTFDHVPAKAGGGAILDYGADSPLPLTANTAFQFASDDAVTSIHVSAVGFHSSEDLSNL